MVDSNNTLDRVDPNNKNVVSDIMYSVINKAAIMFRYDARQYSSKTLAFKENNSNDSGLCFKQLPISNNRYVSSFNLLLN